ncbi:MAG TPA: hypothetical protein VH165_07660 [Kofleriaceae bacterium]|jgi:hypothetical protein|nr:hypothetical protein [Kofleriaceae bacterium]
MFHPIKRLANLISPLADRASHARPVGQLFDALAVLQRRSPAAVHWVHALPGVEGAYLTTRFQHPMLHRYSGHEVVIFTRDRGSYYWMPGARHDATGHVPFGSYRVDAELANGGVVRLRLDKRYPTAFVLGAPEGDDTVHRVVPRPLPPGVLHEELYALVEIALSFQLQVLHADGLHADVRAVMADGAVAAACRGITPRLDTLLGLIDDALIADAPIDDALAAERPSEAR